MQRENESSFTHRSSVDGQVPLSLKDIETAAMPCYTKPEEKSTCTSFLMLVTICSMLRLSVGSLPSVCDICFEEMESGSAFRQIPCNHIFHKPCIDEWMASKDASCPICRHTFYYLHQSQLSSVGNMRHNQRHYHHSVKYLHSFGQWIRNKFHFM